MVATSPKTMATQVDPHEFVEQLDCLPQASKQVAQDLVALHSTDDATTKA